MSDTHKLQSFISPLSSSGYQPPPPYATQPAPPRPVMQQQLIHGTFDQGARFDPNKPVTLPVSESSVHYSLTQALTGYTFITLPYVLMFEKPPPPPSSYLNCAQLP